MASAPLNHDVLLSILCVSPPQTATSIMETCSFLYHEGAKVILQDPINPIDSEEQSLALLRFIQAEDLSRCSYVVHLHITKVPESVAQILADILPRMTGLKRLALCGDPERMFESYPYLLPAFAALRTLNTLIVAAGGEKSCEMIRTLRSELSFANLHFSPIEPSELSIPATSHPILMLQQSASSLTELSCSCLFDMNLELNFSPPNTIYPNLHTLQLHHKYSLSPLLFIKAFPNLRYLYMKRALPRGHVDFSSLNARREANLALQPQSRTGVPFEWRLLWKYGGNLVDLWALGLTCRIPHLFFGDTLSTHPPLVLADVVVYAQPTSLTITFENQPLTDVLEGGFLSALRSDGAASLRSLAFILDLMAKDGHLDVGRAFTDLGSALSRLQLRDLLFAVRDAEASSAPGVDSPVDSEDRNSMPSLSLAECTLNDFDVRAFVNRLVASTPTLKNVFVGIERPGLCGGNLRVACMTLAGDVHWQHTPYAKDPVNSYVELTGSNLEWRDCCAAAVRAWNRMP